MHKTYLPTSNEEVFPFPRVFFDKGKIPLKGLRWENIIRFREKVNLDCTELFPRFSEQSSMQVLRT